MAKAARIRYTADGNYVDKQAKEFTLTAEIIEKLDSIEPSAEKNAIQGIKVNGQLQEPDQYRVVSLAIPEVEDNLDSISSTNALSAKQGRFLYNRIKNLEGLGKFLSNWDSTTGMPTTNPQAIPYEYHSGDYYIVGRVGATNYRPDGTSYRGIPSTVVESEEVKVGDFYFFNGSIWELLLNTDRQIPIDESLSSTSTNPVENRVVTAAINLKANDADISVVGKTNDFNDLDNIPDIPDSLDDLTGTSDDIAEGSSHLFLNASERTKLSMTSGTNTGDETNASIMSKLGAASSTTNGYLTVADWSTFNGKQDAISDLTTIRSNASAGKSASDTIATYGDIVTHNANEFATATQGGKADTAIQPGDNVSELTNDAGYVTDAYHDNTKQDKLVAGANIQIAADGKTISATDTTYVASDFDIKDLADSTGLRTTWNGKQDELIAGTNIQIAADGKTISSTDTTYTAGPGISISQNNVISNTQTSAEWGNITGTLSDQTDLKNALDAKQDTLIAGANVQIASDGKTISSTDTTYTAGTGISIDSNNVISSTQTSAEWGNISGTLSNQTDLQSALDAKQDDMVILSYGSSTWNDFITAYNKNGLVYCRASSNSNPATGSQTRLAFMAYVNDASNPTEVEFQYYRSRSNHDSAANQLDEVYVYKLTNNGTWSVTQRDTAAKSIAGTGIGLTYNASGMTISADTSVLATQTDLNSKQDTLVSGTNIKTVNGNSLLGSGNLTLNDVKVSATAPSSPTEGMVWYDTTNDQLKVYDGTNWNVTGKEYNAGPGISIEQIQDYSAMRGPCPEGYHIPLKDEWNDLLGILTNTFSLTGNEAMVGTYLKMPKAGFRDATTSSSLSLDYAGGYWSATSSGSFAYTFSFYPGTFVVGLGYQKYAHSIRPFKDSPVIPDSTWTTLYDGSSVAIGAGIFYNATLGLISISGDGTNWITITDKNLGATVVYNSGDTLSEANCGYLYQWGNNYGFSYNGDVATSSTSVDASDYGPGNYYSSSTFIKGSGAWSNPVNGNLRGGETGVVTLDNAITNTGVLSVNGQTGAVSLTIPTISTITVTLTSAGWSSNSQTVTATGVTANNTVIVSPTPADIADYADCGVYCSAQGSGTLTFTCSTIPTASITVNVLIMNL